MIREKEEFVTVVDIYTTNGKRSFFNSGNGLVEMPEEQEDSSKYWIGA